MHKEVYKLLMDIRKRPGVYLGQKSLTLLSFTLSGYLLRMEHEGISDMHDMSGFQVFVEKRYGISDHNWADIILFYSADEAQAFDRFYELLDEFLSENGVPEAKEYNDYLEKLKYLLSMAEYDAELLISDIVDDNPEDRHYSAVAANNQILSIIAVKKHHGLPIEYNNAREFILYNKLPDGDLEKFEEVLSEESKIYEGKQF